MGIPGPEFFAFAELFPFSKQRERKRAKIAICIFIIILILLSHKLSRHSVQFKIWNPNCIWLSVVILLNLTVTTSIKDYLLSSLAVKAKMSPKRKAFAEVSGNGSQSTYIPRPNASSLPKRWRYQSKSHHKEGVTLPVMPKDGSLAGGLGSAHGSGPGGQVSDGKTIGVRKWVDAKTLPDVR
ncbi:hypothetical protein HOY82DRAFT_571200 [Tuber indicum]|nr:hypothetical protein HOY82DRAFT_571200 [Tuber indicum]